MSELSALGEFGLIRTLTRSLPKNSDVIVGIGDDCAAVRLGGAQVLLSCDAMVEGVHFRRDWAPPEAVGWKAAAAALSDIAAMGGVARYMLVALACPAETDPAYLEALYAGLAEAAETWNACVAGGDTVASREGLMIDVAVIGEAAPSGPLRRNGARPGDIIAATGRPGSAALGLCALKQGRRDMTEVIEAHLRPQPRLREGALLAASGAVRAMIDVSDGLSQDLGHIAAQSGVAVHIDAAKLPRTEKLEAYARELGVSFEDCALCGGEDYELAMALDPLLAETALANFRRQCDAPITLIGVAADGAPGVFMDGAPIVVGGYDHFEVKK